MTKKNELYHFGIRGQKWGLRRYQNPDGTLTEEGKKRYYGTYTNSKGKIKKLGRFGLYLNKNYYHTTNELTERQYKDVKANTKQLDKIEKKVRNKTHNSEVFDDFTKQSVELARKGYGGFRITEYEKRKYEETCAKYEKLYKETVAKYADEYVTAFESDSGIKLTEKGKENVRKHYSNIPNYLWI